MTLKELKDFIKDLFREEDIICPVCGYYCLGKGGYGCINKPYLMGLEDE